MSGQAGLSDEKDTCGSCGETPEGECPKSRRQCGHHCNHVWTHDACDWCGVEFTEGGAEVWPHPTSHSRPGMSSGGAA